MAIRRCSIGLALASIFVISIVFLGSVPQATAETLNAKALNHVTKAEIFPIPDVEGHVVAVQAREGVAVYDNGEWAWAKVVVIADTVKGAGTGDQYITITFLDGSTITTHTKGAIAVPPAPSKWSGDIVGGTGRFQGIKGTQTLSVKLLPPEKGEPMGKAQSEGTLVYTLPGK